MTPLTSPRWRSGRDGRSGQMIVVFALCLIAIVAMAGLLIDGGSAWANRRQAQAAADTAALAGAVRFSASSGMSAADRLTATQVAARAIAGANGFVVGDKDCSGADLPNGGVTVNWPPTAGNYIGDSGFVEVFVTRSMQTTFSRVVGQNCWMVTARAVASVLTQVAECSFCSLSTGPGIHKVLMDNGGDLRVDGTVVLNGTNMYEGAAAVGGGVNAQCSGSPCTAPTCHPHYEWNYIRVCGDVIELHETGGSDHTHMSARSISITGGWENRGGNILQADGLADPCPYHPEPPAYAVHYPGTVGNVCIGTPQIPDPLDDPYGPDELRIPAPDPATLHVPQAGVDGCTPVDAGAPLKLPTGTLGHPVTTVVMSTNNRWTICPGLYFGGFSESGDFGVPTVYMRPGIYYMEGGGFTVTGSANITSVLPDGTDDGVMIYNSGGPEAFSSSSPPGEELLPPCDPLTSTCLATVVSGGGSFPNGLTSNHNPATVGQLVTYTMRMQHPASPFTPSGTVTFYDGSDPIAGCTAVPLNIADPSRPKALCGPLSYALFGSRAITAVYSGDATYAPNDDTLTEVINHPAGEGFGPLYLKTDHASPAYGGEITLHAQHVGRYSGLLIFQDRANEAEMKIWPMRSTAPPCNTTIVPTALGSQPRFMAEGVPPAGAPWSTMDVPDPCGPLGGLSGTIYSPHQCGPGTCGDGENEAVINFNTDGLANVQVIAAQIYLNYETDIRFAFDASLFANGKIRLIE